MKLRKPTTIVMIDLSISATAWLASCAFAALDRYEIFAALFAVQALAGLRALWRNGR